jgi:hypothetical protein
LARMSDKQNARSLLEQAEHAAAAGDLSAADELLRNAARIQEAELGPMHPDLTSTLTNRAIIAEKTGRLGDAETFYRRAAAIASASLPRDDQIVADSQKNLDDFCRDRGLRVEAAAASSIGPLPTTEPAPGPATTTFPSPGTRPSRAILPGAVMIGLIALTAGALFTTREPSRESTAVTTPPPAATKATETAASPPADIASVEKLGAPKAKARPTGRRTASEARRSGTLISLASTQLCQTFSTRGAWRCVPAGDPAARGRLVLFTRVKSPRNATVVHRWYRGGTLQQSVTLPIRATRQGYRTYSRQSINSPGQWRIEVTNAAGDLLFEQSFSVR